MTLSGASTLSTVVLTQCKPLNRGPKPSDRDPYYRMKDTRYYFKSIPGPRVYKESNKRISSCSRCLRPGVEGPSFQSYLSP